MNPTFGQLLDDASDLLERASQQTGLEKHKLAIETLQTLQRALDLANELGLTGPERRRLRKLTERLLTDVFGVSLGEVFGRQA